MTVGGADQTRSIDGIRLDVAVGPLLGPTLSRAVGAIAARAGLTLDRIDDAVLVADTLSDGAAGETLDGRLPVRLESSPGRVLLRVGPLRDGGARRLLQGGDDGVPGAPVIQLLASRARVTGGGARSEYLIVEVGQDG
ncbi:hypothetical protein [Paraconexibacter sp.]|uniref:hypothetical protein n=1 Tax=Paraconexibacter sp. TaxID=2949640 RepID=UPI003561D68A